MDEQQSISEIKSPGRRWMWFITLYLLSLLGFAVVVGLLHLLIPH